MAELPWLMIVGLGEDGADGLPPASLRALDAAEIVIGPARHLSLLPDLDATRVEWPVPFAEGLTLLHGYRGRRVVALASGDPFWFGAGSVIARGLEPDEWRALPSPSSFALAASRLGWALETTVCLGLHATPLARLRPHLARGERAILLLRDGAAVADLARYLVAKGFGASHLTVMEALGGPRERIMPVRADALPDTVFTHPVAVAAKFDGTGRALPCASGISDDLFTSDGQITKRPVRALALSALAPQPGEVLWDIGGGSGSISVEWCLSHPRNTATCVETRPDRAAHIRSNAQSFGLDHRLSVVEGMAPDALADLSAPDAVFIGGGLSEALLDELHARLASGTRLVAHAVTLESEALLAEWSGRIGGDLMRIELASAAPLGTRRGWVPARPIVQWQVVL
ncbi:bifunctional cobalt-precorrin-7 (C(5))-methyltransferase/cobalt-precorrin-6B (C(15))-methyltransferase [Roseovarius tolerans]|jgi:precorrin-6Y C5,15-methyltransferase (decarboxylating)|nr:bifunctional cobalt-precorrin-7 (C(5))-methyltransferase/cobalt-precorrin-6B (C(15))-methyltransferase [Roseovarius tolerans]